MMDLSKLIVIGASAGGREALRYIFKRLPWNYAIPIVTVLHLHRSTMKDHIKNMCTDSGIPLKEAEIFERIQSGQAYFAPADYHLLLDDECCFTFNIDPCVHYSRPSIDILFESCSYVFQSKLIAIILSGANKDGAMGVNLVRKRGGVTIAQNPLEAEFPTMPQSAIELGGVIHIYSLDRIIEFLLSEHRKAIL